MKVKLVTVVSVLIFILISYDLSFVGKFSDRIHFLGYFLLGWTSAILYQYIIKNR